MYVVPGALHEWQNPLVDEPPSDAFANLGIPGDFAATPDSGEQPAQVGAVKYGRDIGRATVGTLKSRGSSLTS